jgi:hypothetical protein
MLQNLINKYQILQVSAQKELMDYLDDLLQKQENNKQIQGVFRKVCHSLRCLVNLSPNSLASERCIAL